MIVHAAAWLFLVGLAGLLIVVIGVGSWRAWRLPKEERERCRVCGAKIAPEDLGRCDNCYRDENP